MVSIADVAEKAGVSPTTVSHALSGKRKVSDAVKQRVEQAMALLDYVPSRSAQNLALGMTRILAVLVPDIGNGYFAQLAKGAEAAAVARGYNILICGTGYDNAREVQYLEMIHSRTVDGVDLHRRRAADGGRAVPCTRRDADGARRRGDRGLRARLRRLRQ